MNATTFGYSGGRTEGLLLLSGIVTTVPLLCFGQAARRLPLSTMGFCSILARACSSCSPCGCSMNPFCPSNR